MPPDDDGTVIVAELLSLYHGRQARELWAVVAEIGDPRDKCYQDALVARGEHTRLSRQWSACANLRGLTGLPITPARLTA